MGVETSLDLANEKSPLKVIRLNGTGAGMARMMQMGILPGTPLEILRKAPMDDPIEIKVRGSRIMLRLDECRNIMVAGAE